MEPITHFLTGACMGRAGLNRKTALATAVLTLAAEAPDLDVLGASAAQPSASRIIVASLTPSSECPSTPRS
ncbi:MAG: hypothetical protein WAM13_16010 [Candidatus Sulfotelmatobacter sp.]